MGTHRPELASKSCRSISFIISSYEYAFVKRHDVVALSVLLLGRPLGVRRVIGAAFQYPPQRPVLRTDACAQKLRHGDIAGASTRW